MGLWAKGERLALAELTPKNSGRFPLLVAARSGNSKVGRAAATYRPVLAGGGVSSCPVSCVHGPLRGGSCYATSGWHSNRWQGRSFERRDELDKAFEYVEVDTVRHHVSGDLLVPRVLGDEGGVLDTAYLEYLVDWHRAVAGAGVGLAGYVYTHAGELLAGAGLVAADLEPLRVLVSADDAGVAEWAVGAGFQVAASGGAWGAVAGVVGDAVAAARGARVSLVSLSGRRAAVCPHELQRHAGVGRVQCVECRLCIDGRDREGRVVDIVFPTH